MTDEQLAEIEARANAATPGPWRVTNGHPSGTPRAVSPVLKFDSLMRAGQPYAENADFIAHARADIPALISALRAAQARVAELEKEHTRLRVAIGSVAEDAILCEAGYSSPTFDALVHKIKLRVDSAIEDAGRRIANSDKGDPAMQAMGS